MGYIALTIVLAEDDEGHAILIERNLRRAGFSNGIIHVTDGQETLDLIRGEGRFTAAPPNNYLLMLDINMPKVDGVEVLRQLKGDPKTSSIPIIMLTTTDDPAKLRGATSSVATCTSPSRSPTRPFARPSSSSDCSSRWSAFRRTDRVQRLSEWA